jgi:hypothetical protein
MAALNPINPRVTTACTECRRARRKVSLRPLFPLAYDADSLYLVPSVHRAGEMQEVLLQRPPMHHRARFETDIRVLERRAAYPSWRIWAGRWCRR